MTGTLPLLLRTAAWTSPVLISILGAGGCAPTLNQTYQRIDHIPEGKAVVYIYRNPFIGAAFSVDVAANSTPVHTLYTATYYPFILSPGMVEFSAKMLTGRAEPLSVFLKPGASYYLKIWFGPNIGMMQGGGLTLTVVPESEAEQELTACKLLREPGQ